MAIHLSPTLIFSESTTMSFVSSSSGTSPHLFCTIPCSPSPNYTRSGPLSRYRSSLAPTGAPRHSISSWKKIIVRKHLSSFSHSRRRRDEVGVTRAGIDVGYEFEDAFGSLILPPQPEPVLFPRKVLNLKFAVLLMRSAYEAVDALDFIPMDKFQIRFWKLRQSEVEPYTLQCRPLRVKYGDLTDPLYFDFISFSQFATISNEMRTGEVVFQEKMGSDGELRTVRRDERLKDNATLPTAFIDTAGKMLYDKLLEGFEGEVFNAPSPCDSSSEFSAVTNGVKQLLQVFVDKGYALKASVEPVQFPADKPGGKIRVKLEGSATQWGVRALASRRSLLLNDFAALALGAYLQASGRTATHKVRYSDTSTEQLWTIV